MSVFSCAVQAESNADKPGPMFEEQRIYPRESHPVTDEAEMIGRLRYALNDFSKLAMYSRLAAGKTHLFNAAALTFAQHLFQDRQRQIAGCRMPLIKTVAAAQVTAISQLNDDTR